MVWNFQTFYYSFDSPPVKGNLISGLTKLVYKLLHELLNDVTVRILGYWKYEKNIKFR